MRDAIITEVLVVLREHQADLRAAGYDVEAEAGEGYIRRIEARFPTGTERPAPLLTERRRR